MVLPRNWRYRLLGFTAQSRNGIEGTKSLFRNFKSADPPHQSRAMSLDCPHRALSRFGQRFALGRSTQYHRDRMDYCLGFLRGHLRLFFFLSSSASNPIPIAFSWPPSERLSLPRALVLFLEFRRSLSPLPPAQPSVCSRAIARF